MTEIKLPPLPDFASEDSTLWQLLLDWRTEDGGPRSPLIESAIDAEINSTLQAYARSAIALNATPPTGEVKPEAARGKFESAQHYANRQKMAVTSQWLAGWDACIEYLATLPPEVKPAPALSDAIADELFDYQRIGDKMPPLDREGFREIVGAIQAALAAQETPNAQALSAQPAAEPVSDESIDAFFDHLRTPTQSGKETVTCLNQGEFREVARCILSMTSPQPQPPHQEQS